jgi:hypothetical protein
MLRQRSFGPVLLTLGLLHLSVFAARHLPIGAVLLLPLSTAALTREAEGIPRLRRMLEYSRRLHAIDRRVWGLLPVVLVLAGAIAGLTFLTRAGHVGFNASRFPVRAADFLDRQDPAGRVFTKDQWGGYLIYRFAGGRKVFLDGRSDFYGREMLETYAQVVEVRPGWETVLDRYDVRFVLAAPDQALASALRLNPRWRPVHEDPVAAVFERAG